MQDHELKSRMIKKKNPQTKNSFLESSQRSKIETGQIRSHLKRKWQSSVFIRKYITTDPHSSYLIFQMA